MTIVNVVGSNVRAWRSFLAAGARIDVLQTIRTFGLSSSLETSSTWSSLIAFDFLVSAWVTGQSVMATTRALRALMGFEDVRSGG